MWIPWGPIIICSEKIHQSKSSETWSRTNSPMCTNFTNWQSSLGRIVQASCSMHVTWLSRWKPLDRTQSLNWRFAEYEAQPKFTLGMTSVKKLDEIEICLTLLFFSPKKNTFCTTGRLCEWLWGAVSGCEWLWGAVSGCEWLWVAVRGG